MVKKIFWQDPYLTELDTTITSVHDNCITVAETIFFAFSGGQESDHGTIAGYNVLKAQKEDKEIVYTLENSPDLHKGDTVKIILDRKRRYKLMRLHFAAELILELISKQFPDIIKIGAHIAQDKARIDFQWNQNITPYIESLQQKAQAFINLNQPIITGFSDEANEKRYWKVKGFAQVPCGGTHVKKTGELGTIQLKRVNPGKGKERIEIYLS